MALSTTNPITGTTGTNTINGNIYRIAKTHWDIKKIVDSLGLTVPSSITDSNEKDSNSKLTDKSHIETTYATLNLINNLAYLEKSKSTDTTYLSGNQTLNAGTSLYVPVGYNRTAFTVNAKSLADQTQGTATAAMIITGATAYVNGTKLTGSLTLDANKMLTTLSWTASDGSTKSGNIVTKAPSAILSGSTATANSIIVDVEVLEDETGETLVKGGTLEAGYYPNAVNIYPRFTKYATKGNRINIETSKTATQDNHSSVEPSSGYDYLGKVVIGDAALPALSVTAATTSSKVSVGAKSGSLYPISNVVTAKTSYSTAGWISTAGLDAVTSASAVLGYMDAALITVSASNAAALSLKPVINIDTTDSSSAAGKNIAGITGAVGTKGTSEPTAAGSYFLAVKTSADATGKTVSITPKYTATAGYIPTTATAVTGTAATGKVTLTASDTTYIPITAGSHTIGNLLMNPASGKSGHDSHVGGEHYYVKCDTTTGFQEASSTYIDLGAASTHSISEVKKQGTTAGNGVAANSYYVQCDATQGYTGETSEYKDLGVATISGGTVTFDSTTNKFVATASVTGTGYIESGVTAAATAKSVTVGSGATLTTATASKSIAANTYYNTAATVNVSSCEGILADGDQSNANINSTTKLGDLTSNTKFTNSSNKFFSAFTVEVEDTIALLRSI